MSLYHIDKNSPFSITLLNSGNLADDFNKYAEDFFNAAESVIHYLGEDAAENGDIEKLDLWYFAMVYLYRQSMELLLKANIFKIVTAENDRKLIIGDIRHDLKQGYDKLLELKDLEYTDNDNANWLWKYLADISRIDKESDMFRYPFGNNLNVLFDKQTHISLAATHDNMNTEFYCNDMTRYLFENEYIIADAIYRSNELCDFEIGYHILDKRVSERLDHFELVRKCLDADIVRVAVENESGLQMIFSTGHSRKMWKSKQHVKTMFGFWLSGMKKLKAIEEYYEIEFELQIVSEPDELDALYEAIDFVYDGMMLRENCEITLPGNLFEEDFEIEEPVLFEENKIIPLKDRVIQGVVFRPYRSALLPGKVKFAGKSENDIVRIPGCCEYRIVEG